MKVYLVFNREYDAEHDLWDVFSGFAFASKQSAQNYCDRENESMRDPDTKYFIEEVKVDD